ncbi:hypothetical protein NDU88_001172 [Pleurodeles waltl]|uniref:Uncharacterized protein n=1 Tax=Pleurodeles waltl TaxID=8319 RepID=A0AAV7VVM7_PLEWA|nr:hypothetical protein NDU88_001172 [Pleurodeles waltl]
MARKETLLKCATMKREVMELEGLALASSDPEDRDKLKLKQQELRALVENHTSKYVTAVNCRLYKVGEKAGKLLAWLERKEREHVWCYRWKMQDMSCRCQALR